jgi:hypothetical protein
MTHMKEPKNTDPGQGCFGFSDTPLRGDGSGCSSNGHTAEVGKRATKKTAAIAENKVADQSETASDDLAGKLVADAFKELNGARTVNMSALLAAPATASAGISSARTPTKNSPKQPKKEKADLISAKHADKKPTGFSLFPAPLVTAVELIPARDVDVGGFEKKLAKISDPEERLRLEMEWLIVMRRNFEGGLKLLSIRDGFILYWVKSVAPDHKFGLPGGATAGRADGVRRRRSRERGGTHRVFRRPSAGPAAHQRTARLRLEGRITAQC